MTDQSHSISYTPKKCSSVKRARLIAEADYITQGVMAVISDYLDVDINGEFESQLCDSIIISLNDLNS